MLKDLLVKFLQRASHWATTLSENFEDFGSYVVGIDSWEALRARRTAQRAQHSNEGRGA